MSEIKKEIDNKNQDNLIADTGMSFRDKVSSIDSEGKRILIYPTKPSGKFHRARIITALFLLLVYFILPFIKYKGEPYFLIDLISRKFILFGTVYWPHDFYIFAVGLLMLAVFIVFFTAIFGRIWCGWACPQTVFMELVFRKIEYFIEGNASKQKSLKKSPLNGKKFLIKFSKHLIFIVVTFLLSAILLSYFLSSKAVFDILTTNNGEHLTAVITMSFIALFIYFDFAWFREQMCIYVCPYGRLQSVLLDKNTVVVAYDHKRGEPRDKQNRNSDSENDCIDCGACVRVCPTGIDIRNGTQLECVNCTNCIDACDRVMDSINKPKGLIRYASLNQIEQGEKFKFSLRLAFYTGLLVILVGIFSIFLFARTDIEATILRARGSTYTVENDLIDNLYTIKLINKTFKPLTVRLQTGKINSTIIYIGTDSLRVKPDAILEGTFILKIPKNELKGVKNKINIDVFVGNRLIEKVQTIFSGP